MEMVLDALKDALIDTAKMMPLLYAVYVVIEFIGAKFGDRLGPAMERAGKAGPLIGAVAGIVPQCGVSVMGAALYTQRLVTVGTLFAVFLATSDEAIPVILSRPESAGVLVPLIITKLIIAIVVGYALDFVFRRRNRAVLEGEGDYTVVGELLDDGTLLQADGTKVMPDGTVELTDGTVVHTDGSVSLPDGRTVTSQEMQAEGELDAQALLAAQRRAAAEAIANTCYCGCCAPAPSGDDNRLTARDLLWHPLLHTLQVSAFIFVISFVLALVFEIVGEQTIAAALEGKAVLQPVLAALIGLIPNCAASVVVTELYLDGVITFGATVAGLAAGGGLGVLLLFEELRDRREALVIVGGLFAISVIVGLIIQALGIAA